METVSRLVMDWLLTVLALPEVGLPTVFLVSLVSATLLPLGSEPAVFGYVTLAPDMFWAAIAVATVGNTLGGAISYAMGLAAKKAARHWRASHERAPDAQRRAQERTQQRTQQQRRGWRLTVHRWSVRTRRWLRRHGAPVLLLSWLPAVGDPLCAVAGWLRLPFWPCVAYMALGKLGRYWVMTTVLVWAAS